MEKKEEKTRPTPWFTIGFIAVVGLAALAIWSIIYTQVGAVQSPQKEMLMELSKVLAQLALVTLLGATVTALYNRHAKALEEYHKQTQQRQQAARLRVDEDNDLRRALLASVIDVRAQVERARREFRLLPPGEAKDGYRTAILKLLDARLRLSQVWHDTVTWEELYPKEPEVIPEQGLNIQTECPEILEKLRKQRQKDQEEKSSMIQHGLGGMKIFLDGLIGEYERNLPNIQSATKEEFPGLLPSLCCFHTFVNEKDGGPLYTEVFLKQYYRPVARIIRQSILESGGKQ